MRDIHHASVAVLTEIIGILSRGPSHCALAGLWTRSCQGEQHWLCISAMVAGLTLGVQTLSCLIALDRAGAWLRVVQG